MHLDHVKAISKGALTYVPFLYSMLSKRGGGNTESADYCYDVWLQHLALVSEVPSVVAEFGPGNGLGTGIAALFSGADRYIGLDVHPFASSGQDTDVAQSLLRLFEQRAPYLPRGGPDFDPDTKTREFPSTILNELRLDRALAAGRIDAILKEARVPNTGRTLSMVNYRAPWSDLDIIDADSVDLIFSQAVLEHVVQLPFAMKAAYRWLKPGGLMSHQFDLRSHGITSTWDGHRAFNERAWRIVVGKRPLLINRLSYSAVLRAIEDAGFEILVDQRQVVPAGPTLPRSALCPEWTRCSDEDLNTSGGFIQARKPS